MYVDPLKTLTTELTQRGIDIVAAVTGGLAVPTDQRYPAIALMETAVRPEIYKLLNCCF